MPGPIDTALPPNAPAPTAYHARASESPSPTRPPVSPITPKSSFAQLAPVDSSLPPLPSSGQAAFMQMPAPVPISESQNPDAIALRAAIAVLQIQKEKSKRDIQTLQRVKEQAAAQPERFTRQLLAGQLRREGDRSDPLNETFEDTNDDEDEENEDEDVNESKTKKAKNGAEPDFEKLPSQQNVFRCPPVNWGKYHVVGQSLDRMHEEQRTRPASGAFRASEHLIAAPYSPFKDPLTEQHPMQTRRGSQKPSS